MKWYLVCGVALVGLAVFVATSESQPPERGNRESSGPGLSDALQDGSPSGAPGEPPEGPPGPPPGGFGPGGPGGPPQPGQIIPGFMQEQLKLTDAQKKKLDELQKEVDARLAKILTPEQLKQLKEMRPGPGGPGGGPGGPGGGPGGPGGGTGGGPGGGPSGPGDSEGPPPGPPPGGFGPGGPGQGGGPGGFGPMGRANTKATGVYTIDGGKQRSLVQQKDVTYRATKANQSAILLIGGAKAEFENVKATKSGDSSSEGESNFSGLNAVVLANGGSTLVIQGGEFSSDAHGANGFFACGKGSEITVHRAKFKSTKSSARGLDATNGGKVTANQSVIETDGAHSRIWRPTVAEGSSLPTTAPARPVARARPASTQPATSRPMTASSSPTARRRRSLRAGTPLRSRTPKSKAT